MTVEFGVSIAGTLLGVVSLAYAYIQGVRMRELRRRIDADVWLAIRTVRSIIAKLETTQARDSDAAVAQVYGKATELFRQLLKEAALAEPKFSEATVDRWKAAGKLASDWQVAQARHFLATPEIGLYTTSRAKMPGHIEPEPHND